MTIEHNNGEITEKEPEVKWGGPERLDGLTGRLVAAGLLMYEAFRRPLRTSILAIDFSKRSVSVEVVIVESPHRN